MTNVLIVKTYSFIGDGMVQYKIDEYERQKKETTQNQCALSAHSQHLSHSLLSCQL